MYIYIKVTPQWQSPIEITFVALSEHRVRLTGESQTTKQPQAKQVLCHPTANL